MSSSKREVWGGGVSGGDGDGGRGKGYLDALREGV